MVILRRTLKHAPPIYYPDHLAYITSYAARSTPTLGGVEISDTTWNSKGTQKNLGRKWKGSN